MRKSPVCPRRWRYIDGSGGKIYRPQWPRDDDGKKVRGVYDSNSGSISIGRVQPPPEQAEAFIHEMMHHIWRRMPHGLLERIAVAVVIFIRLNPELCRFILYMATRDMNKPWPNPDRMWNVRWTPNAEKEKEFKQDLEVACQESSLCMSPDRIDQKEE